MAKSKTNKQQIRYDKKGNMITDAQGNLVLNKDTWTHIKGKLVDKTLRDKMPAKSKIFKPDGSLKIDQDVYDELVDQIKDRWANPKTPTRDKQGRFAKRQELGMDKMLEAMKEEQKKGLFSPNEEALLSLAELRSLNADEAMKKSLNTTLKQTGAVRNKAWYDIKYYTEKGELDMDKATDEQLEDLARAMIDGTIDTSSMTEDDVKELMSRVWGDSEEEEEKQEVAGSNQPSTITPRPGTREQELRGIVKALKLGTQTRQPYRPYMT